jgi:Fibronectin type III domain
VFKFIQIILMGLMVSGCVGTIQDSATPNNLQSSGASIFFNFPGITTARPIAHDKIELEFFPAAGGADIAYKLYINGSSNPVPVDPQALYSTLGGRYVYTVENLNPNQEYQFKLTAANAKLNSFSQAEAVAYATTFDNKVSQFHGVSKLSLVPGQSSSSILVDWIASPMGGIFTAGPYDVAHYEITYISEIGGAANLNNPTYGGTDRQVVLYPAPPIRATPLSNPSQFIIGSLASNLRYFVQVRAINSLFQNYAEDTTVTVIPVSREVNTKFLNIKTDPGGSLFDFNLSNVILSNATGLDAFDKINVFWQPGVGSFASYRVFARKYDGTGSPATDDKLTEAMMLSMTTSGNYTSVPSTDTSRRLTGLDNQAWYQVKVALCKTAACPVAAADSNAALISDVKAIKVQPTLAAFSGINSIEPPGQYNERDVVKLRFDAPIMSTGFANVLEFYCVNPADKTQMVKFDGSNTITGSPVARCNGLSLGGVFPSIGSYTSQKVNGLITDGAHEYCFAATPAIIGNGPEIRLSNMIVRCSFPEVLPPSVAQFPGAKNYNTPNACSVTGATAKIQWDLPTGGIYSGFQVYWKEKNSSAKFTFLDGINAAAGYSQSTILSAGVQDFTATGLMPGKTYQIGVLAVVDMVAPANDLYSEYNLHVVDCVIPLPVATFKGFTRIFAVGPKVDGRFPNETATKAAPVSSYLYEAIDVNGVPFEVGMDSTTSPSTSGNYTLPPGRDAGGSFAAAFDGAPEGAFNYSMSKHGIVSLAWEEVAMSYSDADTFFLAGMPAAPAPRSNRLWGYKIFRSSDNKLTWKDLTATHGNVYSLTYSYQSRPGISAAPKRMAFFTDYSVNAMTEVHDASTARDIDRARVYYYKIVPMFNGIGLNYSNTDKNIVKVTLPPQNMALVHRWMANRARCLELDKNYDISNNYRCNYNGIGARPKNIPYQTNDTSLDQGGDLLVDRNELGCRYTRGDKVDSPEVGASYFNLGGARRDADDINYFPLFRGFRSVGTTEDDTTPFKGCTGSNSMSKGLTGTAADYPSGFSSDYQHVLQGDCIGAHYDRQAQTTCSAQDYADGKVSIYSIMAPGIDNFTGEDCSDGFSNNPKGIINRYMGHWAPNRIMQSEFLGVFYNTYTPSLTSGSYLPRIQGPAVGSLTTAQTLTQGWGSGSGRFSSQCSINLASIDGQGYMKPRWISLNDLAESRLSFKGATPSLLEKTVAEVTEVKSDMTAPLTFYNGVAGDGTAADWKLPVGSLQTSSRYRQTTRLGRILSSNSAKLPPLGRLSHSAAFSLCSNYWVQVGSASENGTFAAEGVPVAKRPLRRQESITASAWPETFDTTAIADLETSNSIGSCNSLYKGVVGDGLSKGSSLTNRMSHYTNSISGIPLLTGSGPYNGLMTNVDNYHSSRCMSRYGIQDIAGNISEYNSESIFCDYSQDASYLGPTTGIWGGGRLAENQGDGGPDINFFNDNEQRQDWLVLMEGNIGGVTKSFEIQFRDGVTAPVQGAKPWVRISVDSGYCSVVDQDPAARTGNRFADITGLWQPLFLPGGALNTNIIKKTQRDVDSVLTWRNGDGRFLDFGPKGLGPALNRGNSMALRTSDIPVTAETMQGKYFNPIIGFPLKCNTAACNDPVISTFNDNTSVSTTDLFPNIAPPPSTVDDQPAIDNYPVGNSQITHLGISDYDLASTGHITTTVPLAGEIARPYMLVAAILDDPVTKGNLELSSVPYPGAFVPGDTIKYYQLIWDIPRGSDFSISSGGESRQRFAGRFTANLQPNVYDAYGNQDFTQGVRCATLINQD